MRNEMFRVCAVVASAAFVSLASNASAFEYDEDLIDHGARHRPTALNDSGWLGGLVHPHGGFYYDGITNRYAANFTNTPSLSEMTITGINASGDYVGYAFPALGGAMGSLPSLGNGPSPAFPAPKPSGCSYVIPMDLADTGLAAGFSNCAGTTKAYTSTGSTAQLIPTSGANSVAQDVSPSGDYVVGWQSPNSFMHFPHPNYYSAGMPFSKHLYANTHDTQAYRWDTAQQLLEPLTSNLGGLPAGAQVVSTTAHGVNDDGATVGYVTFTLNGANAQELPVIWPSPQVGWVLPAVSTSVSHDGCRANAINSDWQVVGSCYRTQFVDAGGFVSFVWDITNGSRDLNPLTDSPTAQYTEALDINDYGQITVAVFKNTHSGPYDDPGVALLSPTSMTKGNCNVNNVCNTMYPNQCAAHGGQFGHLYMCTADPDPGVPMRLMGKTAN